jgi:hypothetical protein
MTPHILNRKEIAALNELYKNTDYSDREDVFNLLMTLEKLETKYSGLLQNYYDIKSKLISVQLRHKEI